MTENYRGCYEYLSAQYPEVGGYEFYKELFPDNEHSGERHTDFSHPNAVYLYRDEQSEDKKLRRRKMYNDTWEQDYMEFVEGNSLIEVFRLRLKGHVVLLHQKCTLAYILCL